MKKIFAIILLLILFFTQTAYAEVFYNDVFEHWSREDVNYTTNVLKLFNGYDDMTFRPNNNITRSEFLAILVRLGVRLGVIEETYMSSMNYSDMNVNEWSYTYVISFYEHMKKNFSDYTFESLFQGSKFEPDRPITREEAVALIGVICKNSIYDNNITFTDIDISYKYYKQVKNLYNSKILTGYDDNTVKLSNKINRGESAALIRKVYEDVKLLNNKTLTGMNYLTVKGEDVLSIFGLYNMNTKDEMEKKYLKARTTLEDLGISGYIFPEDKHIYDSDPIGTLKLLRNSGFPNISGVNFYLLKYGKIPSTEGVLLASEILRDIVDRNDLSDADLTQLISLVNKYNVTESLYMDVLKKWYDTTTNMNVKFNIKAYRYEFYIKNGNRALVKAMMYEDIQAGTNFDKILYINWNVDTNKTYNFLDLSSIRMYYSMYNTITYTQSIDNPTNANTSILRDIVLVDNNQSVDLSPIKNEEIYYKYSLNKAYIFKNITSSAENERAFIELINDYKIVKSMSLYKNKKVEIDENYNSILKYFKR